MDFMSSRTNLLSWYLSPIHSQPFSDTRGENYILYPFGCCHLRLCITKKLLLHQKNLDDTLLASYSYIVQKF